MTSQGRYARLVSLARSLTAPAKDGRRQIDIDHPAMRSRLTEHARSVEQKVAGGVKRSEVGGIPFTLEGLDN